MKTILIFIFCISYQAVSAQVSGFYNSRGKLIADTAYHVSDPSNLPRLQGGEQELIYSVITRLRYPTYEIDNSIEGLVIIEISLRNDTAAGSRINRAIPDQINIANDYKMRSRSQQILHDLDFLKSRSFIFNKKLKADERYKYYIPILFAIHPGTENKMESYFKDGLIVYRATVVWNSDHSNAK